MKKLTLMAAIAATWAATAGAASVELVTGYKSFVDFSVEFTTKPQETCLAATLTRVSLQGGATKADIPAVLTHSADYGDLVVVSVRSSAFAGCAALKELVLPESLTNVAAGVFAPCAKLGRVTFEGAPPAGLAAAGLARDVVLYYNGEFADDWAAAVAACGFTHAHEIKAVEPATARCA